MLIELCITIGAILAKKQKLLAAIGIYYAVNMVISFIAQFSVTIGAALISSPLEALMQTSRNAGCAVIALILFVVAVIIAALSVAGYYVMLKKIERKLNLA